MNFATALLMCSCGSSSKWSAGQLSTHQSSLVLAGVYGAFPDDTTDMLVRMRYSAVGSNLQSFSFSQFA